MVRGGKRKKSTVITANIDGNVVKEKILPNRKRGRPSKLAKDGFVEDEYEKEKTVEETKENGETKKSSIFDEDEKNAEVNGVGTKIGNDFSVKSVGFRQIGSRRKNKPRRAAQVGVECV